MNLRYFNLNKLLKNKRRTKGMEVKDFYGLRIGQKLVDKKSKEKVTIVGLGMTEGKGDAKGLYLDVLPDEKTKLSIELDWEDVCNKYDKDKVFKRYWLYAFKSKSADSYYQTSSSFVDENGFNTNGSRSSFSEVNWRTGYDLIKIENCYIDVEVPEKK